MSKFYKLSIASITRETDKAVSIHFRIPDELMSDFSFQAGQYITIKTELKGNQIRRDYSICSSVKSGLLQVGVKEVKGGLFSTYANRTLKTDDVLEISSPNGRFTFEADRSKERTVVAFAAGSGITPIMSILKTLLEDEPKSKVVLVYGNKTKADTMFYDTLLELQTTYPNRLTIQFVFSQSYEDNALFGRIDASIVNYVFKNKFANTLVDAFYLCGPEDMINAVTKNLVEKKYDSDSIYYELFTVINATEDLESNSSEDYTEITIFVDDTESTFSMLQSKSILDAAIERDIDAPYSCQGGICSSCIARLKEGKTTMRQNNILTDSELAEGFILTCQAHPTSSKVIVDYDDV